MIHHEHPNEDGVIMGELRDALSDLTQGERPPREATVNRGRRIRRRRRRGGLASLGVAAIAVGGALALGLTGVHSAASRTIASKQMQTASADPGTIRAPFFTLVSYTNGTVKLSLTSSQVFDPRELRRALAAHNIPALVNRNMYCSSNPAPPDPNRIGVLSMPRLKSPAGFVPAKGSLKLRTAHTPSPDLRELINHTVMVINPTRMPSGTELAFDYAAGKHLLSVDLVYTNSHTCRSAQPSGQ
jgi:hypothetical protein